MAKANYGDFMGGEAFNDVVLGKISVCKSLVEESY